MVMFAKSTGSILGDLVAYAIVGVVLFVIAVIWQLITGGGRKDNDQDK